MQVQNFLQMLQKAGALVNNEKAISNAKSVFDGLWAFEETGSALTPSEQEARTLLRPHRLVPFLAQLAHESGRFVYDTEIWGPTGQQKLYERDFDHPWEASGRNRVAYALGNHSKGDGQKFRGRTSIQNTGRHNATAFTNWCRRFIDPGCPDFAGDPDRMLESPWEGLSPIWYWTLGNPTGKSLNIYADDDNFEAITRRINGGLNGLVDRQLRFGNIGLAFLGYATDKFHVSEDGIKKFQNDVGLDADGIVGKNTRAAIHVALVARPRVVLESSPSAELVSNGVSNGLKWSVGEDIATIGNVVIPREALEAMLSRWA